MPRQPKPEEEHCVRVGISFDPTQLADVEHYCQLHERTISWVVRKALADWLTKHKDDPVC